MRVLIGQLAVYLVGGVIAAVLIPGGPIGLAAAIAMVLLGLRAIWDFEKARDTK